ncbi:uncharacterized protein M6G45_001297 [Spheniscus humboldti]
MGDVSSSREARAGARRAFAVAFEIRRRKPSAGWRDARASAREAAGRSVFRGAVLPPASASPGGGSLVPPLPFVFNVASGSRSLKRVEAVPPGFVSFSLFVNERRRPRRYRFFKPGGLFGIKQSEEPYAEGQQMQEESKILVSPCAGRSAATLGQSAATLGQSAATLGQSAATLGQSAATLGRSAGLQPFWPACGHSGPVNAASSSGRWFHGGQRAPERAGAERDGAAAAAAAGLGPLSSRVPAGCRSSAPAPFRCAQCGKGFRQKQSLITHERIHTGEKTLQVRDCGKSFSPAANLLTHRRVHTGERPFPCAQCGKSFSQKANLLAHQRIHAAGEKALAGGEQEDGAAGKPKLRSQQRSYQEDTPFVCPECGRASGRSQPHHPPEDPHRRAALHLLPLRTELQPEDQPGHPPTRVHTGSAPSPAPSAASASPENQPGDPPEHPHGPPPYPCGQCQKCFKDKVSLKAHQKTHAPRQRRCPGRSPAAACPTALPPPAPARGSPARGPLRPPAAAARSEIPEGRAVLVHGEELSPEGAAPAPPASPPGRADLPLRPVRGGLLPEGDPPPAAAGPCRRGCRGVRGGLRPRPAPPGAPGGAARPGDGNPPPPAAPGAEKPFICNQCGNSFGLWLSLVAHQKTHVGQKPYPCPEHGKSSGDELSPKAPQEKQAEGRAWCARVRRSFAQYERLVKHRQNHRAEGPTAATSAARGSA